MAHQHRFDFRRRDILAAPDDHVVLAPGEEHVPICIQPSQVSRRAPTVGQRGVIRPARVSFHDPRGANDYFADLPG
jgi:hypothetical protein